MLALDLDELDRVAAASPWFACERMAILSFRRRDYLGDVRLSLKASVLAEVDRLGGQSALIDRVMMLGQVRCLGLYFSPVNFFFCYEGPQARYMLAEVRNTPWNERHCYLVSMDAPEVTPKAFHVSPFMDMDMQYHWRVQPPARRALVHIENHRQGKLFDATLALKRVPLDRKALGGVLLQWPMMSLSIIKGIYWQAFRLWRKGVPYVPHPGKPS
jgi:DUF1365 family protein